MDHIYFQLIMVSFVGSVFFFFLHILMTDTDKLDCSYIVGHDIFFSRITQVILRTSLKHHQILIMFNYKNGII